MKKPVSADRLHFIKRRERKLLKRRLDHKIWKKNKRRAESGLSHIEIRTQRRLRERYWGYRKIVAPRIFSFIKNPAEIVRFVKDLEYHYNEKNKVYIILKDVEVIDYGAIVVLLSIMVKFKSANIDFNGDFPRDSKAKILLKRSGFFENLYKEFEESSRYEISASLSDGIHTHAWKDVDPVLGSKIISQSTKIIWGEERRCQGVQRALIELMQNTNNHASIGGAGEKHWWLSVYPVKEENKVCFSFVDFGVGVFTNLKSKNQDSKFYMWAEKLAQVVSFTNNAEIMRLILNGFLHKTVTRKHYRGKGLPGIAEVMKRNQISNLHIITNDVFCNLEKDEYKTMKDSFSGTFVYWELNKNNGSCR